MGGDRERYGSCASSIRKFCRADFGLAVKCLERRAGYTSVSFRFFAFYEHQDTRLGRRCLILQPLDMTHRHGERPRVFQPPTRRRSRNAARSS